MKLERTLNVILLIIKKLPVTQRLKAINSLDETLIKFLKNTKEIRPALGLPVGPPLAQCRD